MRYRFIVKGDQLIEVPIDQKLLEEREANFAKVKASMTTIRGSAYLIDASYSLIEEVAKRKSINLAKMEEPMDKLYTGQYL